MPTYYVRQGSRDHAVKLTDRDFVAAGGEKKIYSRGETAYCEYHEPHRAIPLDKFQFLASVQHAGFIAPTYLLLDSKKQRVGETQPFIDNVYVLCQLFSNGFRNRNGVDHAVDLHLIEGMLEIMNASHAADVVLVDANDMNWLVSHDLTTVSLIDTSSCQTPGHRGTAIKPAIYDPTCNKKFTPASDYYSMAVVASWLWCGIHPFVVGHKNNSDDMETKMRNGLSIFDSTAEPNTACRPHKTMPDQLRRWIKTCLTTADRPAPPSIDKGVFIPSVVTVPIAQPAGVTLTDLPYPVDASAVAFVTDPKTGETISWDGKQFQYETGETGQLFDIPSKTKGRVFLFSYLGDFYITIGTTLQRIDTRIVNHKVRTSYTKVANLADVPRATFHGNRCVIQDLVGRKVVTTPDNGSIVLNHPPLTKCRVIHAAYFRNVTVISASDGMEYVFVGNKLVQQRPAVDEPNFTVTSKGVVVENRRGDLSAWHVNSPGKTKTASIDARWILGIGGPTGENVTGVMSVTKTGKRRVEPKLTKMELH